MLENNVKQSQSHTTIRQCAYSSLVRGKRAAVMINAPMIDPASIPEISENRRLQILVALFNAGDFDEARNVVQSLKSRADLTSLISLRTTLLTQVKQQERLSPVDQLKLLEAIVTLPPADPEILIRYARIARKVGDDEKYEQALETLATTFPEDPGLKATILGLRRDFDREIAAPSAKLERFALRLAAVKVLDDVHFLSIVSCFRDFNRTPARIAKLRALCPAIAEDPAVLGFAQQWRRNALALPPGMALKELGRIAALITSETLVSDMVSLTVKGGRVPDKTLISALRVHRGLVSPELSSAAAHAWRIKLANHAFELQSESCLGCFDALDALGVAAPEDLQSVIVALDDGQDPSGRLPGIVERWSAAGGDHAFLEERVTRWQHEIVEAARRRKSDIVWSLGRLLLAAGRAGLPVLEAMMVAARRLDPRPAELLTLVDCYEALDIPVAPPAPAKALRSVSDAVTAKFVFGEVDQCIRILSWIAQHHELRAAILDNVCGTLGASSPPELDEALASLELRRPAVAAYMMAVRAAASKDLVEANGLFRRAIERGLTGSILDVAQLEVASTRFHLVSERDYPGEPAIVLIESNASPGLVRLASEMAPSLTVCGATYVGFAAGEINMSEEIEFRHIDMPEVSASAEALTQWAMDALDQAAATAGLSLTIAERQRENVRVHVFRRQFSRLRVAFNFHQAIKASGCRRAFFIVNVGNDSRIPIRWLLSRDCEIRVACGSFAAVTRRRFSAAVVAGPVPKVERGPRKVEPVETKKFHYLPKLAPMEPPAPNAKPALLLVVSTARSDVLSPIPDLVAALAERWRVVLLVIDSAETATFLAGRFARDGRPSVAETSFFRLSSRDLWLEAPTRYDPTRLRQAMATIAKSGQEIDCAGMALTPETVDAFDGLEGAAAVADAIDRWGDEIAAELAPAVALFTHAATIEPAALCTALSSAGVPTMWLQMLQHPRDIRFKRPPATHHLVLDRYSMAVWKEFLGVPEIDITVVGSLRMSATINLVRGLTREETRAELSVLPDEQLVVIATQTVSVQENLTLMKDVRQAVGDVSTVRILVKLHPLESEDRVAVYRRAFDEPHLADRVLVTKSHDIYRALVASDLVVTQHSNVGIEALLLDRAAIALVVGAGSDSFSIGDHGVEEANAGPEAQARIRALLTDPVARASADAMRRALLDANPEMHDGRVAERVADSVQSVYAKARNKP